MILLLAETPVAGTVDRIAYWIEQLTGIECYALIRSNYPNNAFSPRCGSIGAIPGWEGIVAEAVHKADTIIIHNIVNQGLLDLITGSKREESTLLYQFHSPPMEPPQFDYYALNHKKIDGILGVAQGHCRFIENAIPVPNIVPDFKFPVKIQRKDVVFAPHMRVTKHRWSSKLSAEDQVTLRALAARKSFTFKDIKTAFGRDSVTPTEVWMFMHSVRVVVDDINTGLFHQSALEGLKAGCAVLSGADISAISQFCDAIGAPPPPFLSVSNMDEAAELFSSRYLHETIDKHSALSHQYAEKYLSERRLAEMHLAALKPYIEGK
ncbi:hypothetical protein [Massilia sp. HP4]|uniref:hypothetical protein n=1 Tax=Massilia sp. HP4 TaxID=2562316 RepID=UPI0010C0DFE5|nr:hypothetical protein [Massilia sp. HP4]